VPNAYILLYSEPDRLGPPLFSGGPSKADGSYTVTFQEEGTYYLVAKLSEEVAPGAKGIVRPGIMLGKYGGKNHQPLTIKRDEVKTGVVLFYSQLGRLSNSLCILGNGNQKKPAHLSRLFLVKQFDN